MKWIAIGFLGISVHPAAVASYYNAGQVDALIGQSYKSGELYSGQYRHRLQRRGGTRKEASTSGARNSLPLRRPALTVSTSYRSPSISHSQKISPIGKNSSPNLPTKDTSDRVEMGARRAEVLRKHGAEVAMRNSAGQKSSPIDNPSPQSPKQSAQPPSLTPQQHSPSFNQLSSHISMGQRWPTHPGLLHQQPRFPPALRMGMSPPLPIHNMHPLPFPSALYPAIDFPSASSSTRRTPWRPASTGLTWLGNGSGPSLSLPNIPLPPKLASPFEAARRQQQQQAGSDASTPLESTPDSRYPRIDFADPKLSKNPIRKARL